MSRVKIYNPSNKIKTVQKDPIDIPILEAFQPDIIAFDTKEEFIEYLTENKEELDAMTTHRLNKAFEIEGYVITKVKGVIGLKKKTKINPVTNDVFDAINKKLDLLLAYFNDHTSMSYTNEYVDE